MRITKLNDLVEDGEVIKGSWQIDTNHEIRYRAKDKDEQIDLKATILDVEPASLVLAVTNKQTDQKITAFTHRLTGQWKLDSKNRITFEVDKQHAPNDVLTFQGAWKVQNNEVVYTYRETQLKTKRRIDRTLVFKGFWDITDRNRLTYFLTRESDSAFRFRGAFQTDSILAKSKAIRYQVGTEITGKRKIQTIALFGKWKVSRDLSLSFEIEYKDGRRHAIQFGGEYAFDKNRRVEVNLTDRKGKPLGVEVIFSKDFTEDGQLFARFAKSEEESRIEAGVKVIW